MRTVTRLFDSRAQAESAVRDLESAGIPSADLSILASERVSGEQRSFLARDDDDAADAVEDAGESETLEGAGQGAITGGAIGGGVGLLAGLGLLAVPGIGPVLAGGWLASTLAGAAVGAGVGGVTGGILGALKDAGVTDEDAHVYAEGVRRGGALVSVKVDDDTAPRVEAILAGAGGTDAMTRGRAYRDEGWTAFDESRAGH